jgi:hypothetical protein
MDPEISMAPLMGAMNLFLIIASAVVIALKASIFFYALIEPRQGSSLPEWISILAAGPLFRSHPRQPQR